MSKPCNSDWDKETLDELEDKALAALRQQVTMFEPPDVLAEVHRRIAEPARSRKAPALAWAACGLAIIIAGASVPAFLRDSGEGKGKEMVMATDKPPTTTSTITIKAPPPSKKIFVPAQKPKPRVRKKPAPEPSMYWPRDTRHIARATTPDRPGVTTNRPGPSYMIVCTPEPLMGSALSDVPAASTTGPDNISLPDSIPMDSYDIRMTDTETGAVTSLYVTNVINSDGTEASVVDYSVAKPESDPGTLPTDRSYFDENSYPDNPGAALRSSG